MNIRLNSIAGAALIAFGLSLSAPAMAIDTGGNDTSSSTTTTTAAPKAPAKTTTKKSTVPTLAQARADIDAKKWDAAIGKLKLIVAASPKSADAYNLLGYSYRNAGSYDLAGKAYARALKINPKHTGALEYQGVLFIKLGQMDKAKANLAMIEKIAGKNSEEYQDLAKAIG